MWNTEGLQVKTSTNRNVDQQNVDRPERRQTERSTDRNVDKPKRWQSETSTIKNLSSIIRGIYYISTDISIHANKDKHVSDNQLTFFRG